MNDLYLCVSSGESLQQVDAGGDGQVVGVTDTSTIHCLKSTIASAYREQSTLSWTTLPGLLMYVSCSSKYGCWGVNSAQNIYFTVNYFFILMIICVVICMIKTSHHICFS